MTRGARALSPAPATLFDGRTPRFGSYEGAILDRTFPDARGLRERLARFAREKQWVYATAAAGDLFVAAAVVSLGYAAKAFIYVYDASSSRLLIDASYLAPPHAIRIRSAKGEVEARYSFRGVRLRVVSSLDGFRLDAEVASGRVLLEGPAPPGPSITAVAALDAKGRRYDATEKRALYPVRGELSLRGARSDERRELYGTGATDHSHGLMPRHTRWRWSHGLGRAATGERIAFNLVQGFVGEGECAAWVGDTIVPLGEGRFDFDRGKPRDPWRISTACGALKLDFVPGALHEEALDVGIVASKFVQPVGRYRGTLRLADRELAFEALGVAEDQDVRW